MKVVFDRRDQQKYFQIGDLVMQQDVKRQDKGKHGKFDNLQFGPFRVAQALDNNTFQRKNLDDEQVVGFPVNGHYLKHFYIY